MMGNIYLTPTPALVIFGRYYNNGKQVESTFFLMPAERCRELNRIFAISYNFLTQTVLSMAAWQAFLLRTDHSALSYLRKVLDLMGQAARW